LLNHHRAHHQKIYHTTHFRADFFFGRFDIEAGWAQLAKHMQLATKPKPRAFRTNRKKNQNRRIDGKNTKGHQ
jgi:hypothetical protein